MALNQDWSIQHRSDKCAATGTGLIVGGVFNSGILADPDNTTRYDYAPASPAIMPAMTKATRR